jgi:enoyl-CoA hydratase/3-hydroxyacyl-CoA dehydrogenase
MVVPYRRWPQACAVLDGMICQTRRLEASQARELGLVDGLADGYDDLVGLAIRRVKELVGKIGGIPDGPVALPAPAALQPATASGNPLSRQVLDLVGQAIRDAARAPTLAQALEIGYQAFAATACTGAAREGVAAFLEKRAPDFGKTG